MHLFKDFFKYRIQILIYQHCFKSHKRKDTHIKEQLTNKEFKLILQ